MSLARIAGTGSYLPERVVTNSELEGRIDTSDEWIVSRTGIEARHVAADGELTSDLALQAARKALEAAGRGPGDVDLIIVATTTPDMVFPSTACILQSKLGVQQGAAFDVQAVCTGFIYALSVGGPSMVATGAHRCALVIGAEVFSRLLDWNDRRTCVLFGDGAGAVVVSRDEAHGILGTHLGADGSLGHILRVTGGIAEGARARQPLPGNGRTGGVPYRHPHAGRVCPDCAAADRPACPRHRLVRTAPGQCPHHQCAGRSRWGYRPSGSSPRWHATGNTSAASVPLALDTAVRDGRIQAGETLMLQGVGRRHDLGQRPPALLTKPKARACSRRRARSTLTAASNGGDEPSCIDCVRQIACAISSNGSSSRARATSSWWWPVPWRWFRWSAAS